MQGAAATVNVATTFNYEPMGPVPGFTYGDGRIRKENMPEVGLDMKPKAKPIQKAMAITHPQNHPPAAMQRTQPMEMAKGRKLWIASLCLLCFAVACTREFGMILALNEVSSFEAREVSSSPMTIRISGLAFHSAMVVRNIGTVRDGDSLQVLVHLMPTSPGFSGSFSYDLVIPDSINTVSFGNERALIWDRSVGIVKSK